MISLRIRSPSGTASCSLPDGATLSDLHVKIAELTSIPSNQQDLRTGFPPKPVDTSVSQDTLLNEVGIRSGDSIIVAQSASTNSTTSSFSTPAPRPATAPNPFVSSAQSKPQTVPEVARTPSNAPQFVETDGGFLVLRVVPDDNSCLFTAVSLVFNPASSPDPSALRKIVADSIRSNPFTYSEVLLGRPPKDYIETILSPKSWGGAIELSILSTHYQSEIWSIDVQTGRIDKFGEGNGYQNCVFIVYSGIHYDALTFSFAPPSATSFPPDLSSDTTIFPLPVESSTLSGAQRLVETLRKAHNYTDTATFALRCEICREAIVGEKEARQHASQTGHQRFGEYDG
ncbi:hypothetical protein JCM3765_001481 [Sporobolomyces pararoseus]